MHVFSSISGIFRAKKAKRGSEFLNPENLKSMNIIGIFTAKKTKRGSEFLNPENLKSMNILSGIFTVKKAKRGSEFLNPENLKSMAVTMNYKRNIYISGKSEINGNVNEHNS